MKASFRKASVAFGKAECHCLVFCACRDKLKESFARCLYGGLVVSGYYDIRADKGDCVFIGCDRAKHRGGLLVVDFADENSVFHISVISEQIAVSGRLSGNGFYLLVYFVIDTDLKVDAVVFYSRVGRIVKLAVECGVIIAALACCDGDRSRHFDGDSGVRNKHLSVPEAYHGLKLCGGTECGCRRRTADAYSGAFVS